MKIAFITTYDFAIPGGVRNHIMQLAIQLTNLNHVSYIIAPSSNPEITSQIENFIQVAHFPTASNTWIIPPHILMGFRAIKKLQEFFSTNHFDIVHIHEPLIPPLCLSALIKINSPLFATFHTYYEKGQPLYRIFQPLLNKYLKRLKGRIAVSDPAKNYIAKYFPYDYKIIPNGVNIKKFLTRAPTLPVITDGYFNLLFVGHAQFKRKGLRYMLEAYRILKPNYPNLRLIIAGTRWAGRAIPIELQQTNLKDILYLGMVTDDELVALYQAADIFCAPSIGNESFGMILTEAMASNTPIVASNINGYRSVLKAEQDALLVPPKNSLALAHAIIRLIENPILRQKLSLQGNINVQRYAWENIAKDILEYYYEKINSSDKKSRYLS